MSLKTDHLLDALHRVLKKSTQEFHLHEPVFEGNEWTYVKECIDTGWVSSVGSYVTQFEKQIAHKSGTEFGIATVNGTAALHISLKLVGVNPGDEVLIPALTFIATANAVTYCGATPHFVESCVDTLGIDPEKLSQYLEDIIDTKGNNRHTGRKIAAIVPVHIFGHPVDMDPINELAAKYNIPVVEDAAESLGSSYKGKPTGSLGRIAALSFNGNKIITTGGGGAIVTNDPELARQAKHLTTTAKIPHKWSFDHDEIGYNYRMPNINAALGVAQLEKLDEFLQRKRNLANEYAESFKGLSGVSFLREQPWAKSNYWLNSILLDESSFETRNCALDSLHKAGFFCRPLWTLMHRLSIYSNTPRMRLDIAEDIERRLINIPSGPNLRGLNAA